MINKIKELFKYEIKVALYIMSIIVSCALALVVCCCLSSCTEELSEDLKAGEKLEVTLETGKDNYAIYYGSVSEDGREITFSNVPKGNYVLTLRRMIVSETQDNDLPAKGEMTICYYDKRKISVKESV